MLGWIVESVPRSMSGLSSKGGHVSYQICAKGRE
jgi:hypothetical protein